MNRVPEWIQRNGVASTCAAIVMGVALWFTFNILRYLFSPLVVSIGELFGADLPPEAMWTWAAAINFFYSAFVGLLALSWADRFRNVLGVETYNFYSTGEDVVENASANETVASNIWEAIAAAVLRGEKGRHAWVAQEIAKGSDSLFILPLMGAQHGGWGYNREHFHYDDPLNPQPLTFQEAMALAEDVLRTKPYFKRFQEEDDLFAYNGAALYAPDMDEAASTEAGQAGTQYKLLAEAIPARSFAAAANQIDEIALRGYENIDMMGLKKDQNRWPSERPFHQNSSSRQWWHSDFRTVALVHTSPMWQKMIQLGELNRCAGC